MALNFRAKAIATTSLSEVMAGRTKMKTEEVAKSYPKGLTIIDFDIIKTTRKEINDEGEIITVPDEYPVFAIDENKGVYFSGGAVLKSIVNDWIAEYNGDVGMCRKDFVESGGIMVLLEPGQKSSNGNDYTGVTIL